MAKGKISRQSSKVVIQISETETISLTAKQKLFCECYVSKDFFANGFQSYVEAYDPDQTAKGWQASCRVNASKLLTNTNILSYMNHLLDLNGLNDEFVDRETLFLITQKADFSAKLGAIKEYNKLKNRIVKHVDVKSGGEKINQLPDTIEDIDEEIAKINKRLKELGE